MHFKVKAIYRYFSFILIVTLTGGCSSEEETIPCDQFGQPFLTFVYSGTDNGTFSVQGGLPLNSVPSIFTYSWVTSGATTYQNKTYIRVRANTPVGSDSHIIQMYFENNGPGKYPLPSAFSINDDVFSLHKPTGDYVFISGEIEITYYQCQRIKGTFKGVLQDVMKNQIEIKFGNFDVDVTSI